MFASKNNQIYKINLPSKLIGEKTILVPLKITNILNLYFFLKDADLISYAFGVKADGKILKKIASRYLRELMFNFHKSLSIYTKEKNFIGIINFNTEAGTSKIKVGIMIGCKNLWGKGFGTDALKTFIDFIFNSTDIKTIELETAKFNLRAQNSFKRLGFKESGFVSDINKHLDESSSKVIMSLERKGNI